MTVRFDPNRLHAGQVTLSVFPGRGILAENAPSDGDNGAALAYKPEWFGSEIRFEVITLPAHGTLEFFEDTSFIYTGDGTADSAVLQAYIDGVAEVEQTTINFLPAGTEQGVVVIAGEQLTQLLAGNVTGEVNIFSVNGQQLTELTLVDIGQAGENTITVVNAEQDTEFLQSSIDVQQVVVSVNGQQLAELQIVDPELTPGSGEQPISLVNSQQFTELAAGMVVVGVDIAAIEAEQLTEVVTVSLSGRPIDTKQITFTRLTKQFIFIT